MLVLHGNHDLEKFIDNLRDPSCTILVPLNSILVACLYVSICVDMSVCSECGRYFRENAIIKAKHKCTKEHQKLKSLEEQTKSVHYASAL